jgi:hypothetical protein
MIPVSHQIHKAAQGASYGSVQGQCRACGVPGSGVPFSAWVKDGFTNHDLLHAGKIVCSACLFCFEDKSALLREKTGRENLQKMRTYSHFVVDGKWYPLTKGEKRQMRELLSRNPAVAVISETGQKHLIFRARPGWWQFEECALLPCWPTVENLIGPVEELLTGGFSKAEIESGNFISYRIHKFGVDRWRTLVQPLLRVNRSIQFQIAVFLAQKDAG